jgi:NAD(P)-dependent dehydrogenase (short-subunit alcohol dehydrogenase family)
MLPAGKLALITGGGSGIGEAIARAMAENGARVLVADVNQAGAPVSHRRSGLTPLTAYRTFPTGRHAMRRPNRSPA